jgi:hypothetical protein
VNTPGVDAVAPSLSGDTHEIVWQATAQGLSGLFLPSLCPFEMPLPAAVAPSLGANPAGLPNVFTISLSSSTLYVETATGIWSTPTPSPKKCSAAEVRT